MWAWGNNYFGELGDGTTTNRSLPVQVAGLPAPAVAIAMRRAHSYAVLNNGTLWAWGWNADGELGNGTDGSTLWYRPTPGPVSGLTSVAGVAAGDTHSLAVKTDGSVWAWGANGSGQLGTGAINYYTNQLVPTHVTTLPTAAGWVVAGGSISLAAALHYEEPPPPRCIPRNPDC